MPLLALAVLLLLSACSTDPVEVVKKPEPKTEEPEPKPQPDPEWPKPDPTPLPGVSVALQAVATGFTEPVGAKFFPGDDNMLAVVEKPGRVQWVNLTTHERRVMVELEVNVRQWEQGLVGFAFHPDYDTNRLVYISYATFINGDIHNYSAIEEYKVPVTDNGLPGPAEFQREILSVIAPTTIHHGGQLHFGPDGYLYTAFGDGGPQGDPHNNGQNPMTMLGSMIRIDVDNPTGGKEYAVPADNPFVGEAGYLPEIWAWGFRNPWSFGFDNQGRIFLGDVGNSSLEEVNLVEKGGNYGWVEWEGVRCTLEIDPCVEEGYHFPLHTYGRASGKSINVGYVYEGAALPDLEGKLIFLDFMLGNIWGLELPEEMEIPESVEDTEEFADAPELLGQWNLMMPAFGKNSNNELFLTDFEGGNIFQLVALEE